jgi:hypothetical protein
MKKLKIAAFAILGILSVLAISVFIFFIPGSIREGGDTPLLLFNGRIITMDDAAPAVEAVVTEKGRIRYAGSLVEARKMVSPSTVMVDLKGKTLIPGFNDNHAHTVMAASYYSELNLWKKSCAEIAELVAKEAANSEPGELISGNSWDYTDCRAPHRVLLDKAAPKNPVYLVQYSGHAAWVNSAMLAALGITKDTSDPAGGQIVRDGSGEPTGVLRDTAMGSSTYGKYIAKILSPSSHRKLMEKALEICRRAGITSVQDNTWEPFTVRLLRRLGSEGKLTCRFSCWSQGDSFLETIFDLFAFFRGGGLWVREGPVKYFADGAFSTRTGWLFEEYADEPGNTGSPRYTPEQLEAIVMRAARAKRQISIHAIGDRAVHEVLNAVEKAQAVYPWTKDLRIRLEHVQIVKPGDIPRMKKLGVIACVQPFTLNNPRKDVTLLGKKRAETAYPFLTMFRAGVPVSFGSDMPAEVDYHPLLAVYYAVTRKSKDGKDGPLNPRERFTPREALYCYTMGSAYAEFMEKEKGSLTAGRLADMAVLSDDPTSVPHDSIRDIRVLMTIAGGRIVFDAERDAALH